MPDRTHAEMSAIVARGASVLLNTKHLITTPAAMPSPAALALASGDAVSRKAAREKAIIERAKIDAELAALDEAEIEAEPKAEPAPEPEAPSKPLSSPPAARDSKKS